MANLPIPKHCRLPSLAELLRIDEEEEAKAAAGGDPAAREKRKHRETDLEKLRKRLASQFPEAHKPAG